jgi:hypothetical protein
MRLQQPSTLEEIESAGDEGSSEVPKQPATSDPWDYSGPNRDEVLRLLKPNVDRKLAVWLVAAALVAGFGMGWAGGFGWYGSSNVSALDPIIQTEAPSRRIAETKSGKTEGARKTASTLGLRTPPASISVKPLVASPGAAHERAVSSSIASPAVQDLTGSVTSRDAMVPAPETRPTTIEGWTGLDVRGGTAVLGGPDGVRMAARGDTVPGVGRIESIVRWGNRWIVATASGLIATP